MITILSFAVAWAVLQAGMAVWRRFNLPAPLESLRIGRIQYLLLGVVLTLGLPGLFHAGGAGRLIADEFKPIETGLLGAAMVWVGFQAGLAFDLRRLTQPGASSLITEGLQAAISFLLIFAAVSGSSFAFVPHLGVHRNVPVVALLLAAAAITHRYPEPVCFWRRKPSPLPSIPPPSSRLSNSIGLLILGLLVPFAQDRTLSGIPAQSAYGALFTILGLGLILGISADFAFRANKTPLRALMVLLCAVAVVAGPSLQMALPAVSVGFVGGSWFINTTVRRREAIELTDRAGALMESLLLILLGGLFTASLQAADGPGSTPFWAVLLCAAAFFTVRVASRFLGAFLTHRAMGIPCSALQAIAPGVRPMGPLAMAIIMQIHYIPMELQNQVLVTGALLTVVLSQLIFVPPDLRPSTGASISLPVPGSPRD